MSRLRDHSLSLFFLALLLASVGGQSLAGLHDYNAEQLQHGGPTVSYGHYVTSSAFWAPVMENWQSEFLAVGTMAVFTIYLRQRGSPESKHVGAPHDQTGVSG